MPDVRTQYSLKDLPKDRKRLRESIERAIPLSAGHNNRKVTAVMRDAQNLVRIRHTLRQLINVKGD